MSSPPPELDHPDVIPLRARKRDAAARGASGRPRYRACLVCSYVQPSPDWMTRGCPNCESIVKVQGSLDKVKECTSLQFDGVIAIMKPEQSWVARWQRNVKHTPGLYAVRVLGRPPKEVIRRIQQSGIPYIPRDDVSGEKRAHRRAAGGAGSGSDSEGGAGGDGEGEEDLDDFEEDGMVVDDDDEELPGLNDAPRRGGTSSRGAGGARAGNMDFDSEEEDGDYDPALTGGGEGGGGGGRREDDRDRGVRSPDQDDEDDD